MSGCAPLLWSLTLGYEELRCISLYFVNTKDSHEIFMSRLKPFFDFGKKCLNVGIGSQNIPSTVPSKLYAFPMDISAEQKCLNTGGGCKVKEIVCTKCACRSSKLHYFWDKNNTRPVCNICEEIWEDSAEDDP